MVNDAVYNSGNSVSGNFSYIAGTEYESKSFGIFSNFAQHQNAPCAVCNAKARTSLIMVPGKRSCPNNDWTIEYEGNLCVVNVFSRADVLYLIASIVLVEDTELENLNRLN